MGKDLCSLGISLVEGCYVVLIQNAKGDALVNGQLGFQFQAW